MMLLAEHFMLSCCIPDLIAASSKKKMSLVKISGILNKCNIKEIPEDINMDEIKKIIEEENSNIMISNLFRRRCNKSTREFEN